MSSTMKKVAWRRNLIIDTEKMMGSLSILLNRPIKLRQGENEASNSDWIYSQWPKDKREIFRFAIHVVTGKSLLLFLQTDYFWLTGLWENFLISGLTINQGCEGEKIPIVYQSSEETDLGCGDQVICLGWFSEEDFRGYKQLFAQGMVKEYQDLWKNEKEKEDVKKEDPSFGLV